jgi:hypothetical protein
MNIGIVLSDLKYYKDGLKYMLDSRQIYDKLKLQKTYDYANLVSNSAQLYALLGEKEDAGKLYRFSAELFKSLGETQVYQNLDRRAKDFGY